MKGRSRALGPPRRRITQAAVRRELLVFAEGEVTEDQYLVRWRRRNRERVIVRIDGFRGGPRQLVKKAVQAKKDGEREARRGGGRTYDEIWCIFDVDQHPNLAEARNLARAHGINLAVSNPCIELWFMIHFDDQTAYIDRKAAQSRAKAHLGCGKALTDGALDALEQRHADATRRAQLLDKKHGDDGSPPGHNPSSGVWALVDSIRQS